MQAMLAWLVKIRRAPSRHRRDARVYGHSTMAMHKLNTPPPSLSTAGLIVCVRSWQSIPLVFALEETVF